MPHRLPADPRLLNPYPFWVALLQMAVFLGLAVLAVRAWPTPGLTLVLTFTTLLAGAGCFMDWTLRRARRRGRYPRWMMRG